MHVTLHVIGVITLVMAVTLTLGYPQTDDEALLRTEAKKIADEYRTKRSIADDRHPQTASENLRSFSKPSQHTVARQDEHEERTIAEIEALLLLLNENGGDELREIHSEILSLSERVADDPHCDASQTLDCTLNENRKFIGDKEFRTADGTCNNLGDYTLGAVHKQHGRLSGVAYDNGIWSIKNTSVSPFGRNQKGNPKPDNNILPTPRDVSNTVHKYVTDSTTTNDKIETGDKTPANNRSLSSFLFQWGQFLDHDVIKTAEGRIPRRYKDCCEEKKNNPTKNILFCYPIPIAAEGQGIFAEASCMDVRRSDTVKMCEQNSNGKDVQNQYNELTAFIDASNVYGSTETETDKLRTFNGGLLRTSTLNMLPVDDEKRACVESNDPAISRTPGVCYRAGDSRANVFAGLTSLHTLFVREHNRIARLFGTEEKTWGDERIFQETRKIVGAIMQIITYKEFLPLVLDEEEAAKYGVFDDYVEYNSNLDPSITSEFAIAYRFGHSMLPGEVHKANTAYQVTQSNKTEDVLLRPSTIQGDNYEGVEEVMRGQLITKCPEMDRFMEPAVLDKLFLFTNKTTNKKTSFDLALLNIARGRDWGTPGLGVIGRHCNLIGSTGNWTDLNSTHSQSMIELLASVYSHPDDVDLFTGIVTEKPVNPALAGRILTCILGLQFASLKHGDRFWYENENHFTKAQSRHLHEKVTLSRVMCNNLDIKDVQRDAFKVGGEKVPCSEIDNYEPNANAIDMFTP